MKCIFNASSGIVNFLLINKPGIMQKFLFFACLLSMPRLAVAAPVSIINGDSQINGSQNVRDNQTVGGTQTVTGALTSGSLNTGALTSGAQTVNGNSQINGSQTVTDNQVVGGTQAVAGNQTVGGTQTVTGALTSGSLNTGALTSGAQTVNGNSQINGSQTVKDWLVVGAPPPLPPLPGQLYVNGNLITSGLQQCAGTTSKSLCMGSGAAASGDNATSLGTNAQSVAGGTAVGVQTKVTGDNGTAVGAFANATGVDASAFGYNAKATGNKSVAIGTGANAIYDNSTAIGAGAETTRANQVVIGASGTSLTLKGVADKGSFVGKANQSGDTRLLTTDGSGNIGTSSLSLDSIQNSVSKLEQSVRGLGTAVTSAGAMAAAFTAVPQVVLSKQEPVRCGVGIGGYGSSYAMALGCASRLSERYSDVSINAAVSLTNSIDYVYGRTPSFAGRIGVSFPLGKKRVEPSQNNISQKEQNSLLITRLDALQRQVEFVQQQQLNQRNSSNKPVVRPILRK